MKRRVLIPRLGKVKWCHFRGLVDERQKDVVLGEGLLKWDVPDLVGAIGFSGLWASIVQTWYGLFFFDLIIWVISLG